MVTAYSGTNNSISLTRSVTVLVSNQNQVTPSNLPVNSNLLGTDSNNLYGDGSVVVNFSATATSAVSYGLIVNSGYQQSSANGCSNMFLTL